MANWQEDELLFTPQLYCLTPYGKLHHRNLDFIQLANAISNTAFVLALKTTVLVQTLFRHVVFTNYNFRRVISDLAAPQLLVASHITPWAVDEKLRANLTNGIAINVLYDKRLDGQLMLFNDEFPLVLSDQIKNQENNQMIQEYFLGFEGKALAVPKRFLPDRGHSKLIEASCVNLFNAH